jgi:pimeloyl-ACP methyl ester carboxylesterase
VVLTDPAGRARLAALPMPRLLVVGEGDSPGVLAVAEAVRREAPGVEVVSIFGAAHLPNQDATEAFNQLLLRFLGR